MTEKEKISIEPKLKDEEISDWIESLNIKNPENQQYMWATQIIDKIEMIDKTHRKDHTKMVNMVEGWNKEIRKFIRTYNLYLTKMIGQMSNIGKKITQIEISISKLMELGEHLQHQSDVTKSTFESEHANTKHELQMMIESMQNQIGNLNQKVMAIENNTIGLIDMEMTTERTDEKFGNPLIGADVKYENNELHDIEKIFQDFK